MRCVSFLTIFFVHGGNLNYSQTKKTTPALKYSSAFSRAEIQKLAVIKKIFQNDLVTPCMYSFDCTKTKFVQFHPIHR